MTFVLDDPAQFAASALAGFCAVHREQVRATPGGVVRARPGRSGKVALVVGGGSGHYPAFAGYVGPGLADAAVAGDVFASPAAQYVASVARAADRGGGIVLGFGNYAGDVLNFGIAAEQLRAGGIDTRILAVSDDVASAPMEQMGLRRGIAGDLVVFKIAGAAAEAGLGIDEVTRLGLLANARTRSFGVAFTGCTLPGAAEPLFSVTPGHMGVGLGIHGEAGVGEQKLVGASALARLLVQRLVAEAPARPGPRVAAVLNGLGRCKWEELFVLWTGVEEALRAASLEPVDPAVGEFVTSLDMAGCSLTLTWLDDELEPLWRAPVDAPVLRRGHVVAAPQWDAEPQRGADPEAAAEPSDASEASRRGGHCIAALLHSLSTALHAAEAELGRLDAVAGDGDHGQAMSRGAAAAAEGAARAVFAGAGAGRVLAVAGDAWAARAGGTSGALWGAALGSWGEALGDQLPLSATMVATGAEAALQAVTRLGGAQPGDKTLVDAFAPFVAALTEAARRGDSLRVAWAAATEAASRAAEATAQLAPKLGRARPLAARSLGNPDPGAMSLALCARVVSERLEAGTEA